MKLGIALSGGGMRAAIFHLGVLGRLADQGALEQVTQISTVSGGSLIIGALMGVTENRWPTSSEYRSVAYPALKRLLTSNDLFSLEAIGLSGLFRFHHRLLHDRARIFAALIERQWQVKGLLNELPETPSWWINATCLETGKNWRFSKREMGDWQFGRHYSPAFKLADAVAASAAVPYAIGALEFVLPDAGWFENDPATRKPTRPIQVLKSVRLWDGGAYENLGLEPLYKPSRGLIGCDFLICSDASAPLGRASSGHHIRNIMTGRLASPRLFDITSDQIRALRSRMLVGAIEAGKIGAALVRMGNSTRTIDMKSGRARTCAEYDEVLSDDDVASAANHPTDLRALEPNAFDRIARHGYEVTDCTLTTYAKQHFKESFSWKAS